MTNTSQIPPFAKQLLDWTNEGRIDQVESAWLDRIDELPASGPFYRQWVRAMRHAQRHAQAEELLGLLLDARLDAGQAASALRILHPIIQYYPQSPQLRAALVRTLRAVYCKLAPFAGILRLSGLELAVPLDKGLQVFLSWIRVTPGQVYQHHAWGEGVVDELDLTAGKIYITFPDHSRKPMTAEGVRKYLTYLEPSGFLARRTREADALRQLSHADLVKLVLQGQPDRRIKQSALKIALSPAVIEKKAWTRWWNDARQALQLDPMIDFNPGSGAHSVVALRDVPRTFEEEIEGRFVDPSAGVVERADLIRQLARRPKDAVTPIDLARRLAVVIDNPPAEANADAPARQIERVCLLADLAEAVPEAELAVPDDTPLLDALPDNEVLLEIDHADYAVRALGRLMAHATPESAQRAAEILPRAKMRLAQAIVAALDRDNCHDLLAGALRRLMKNPEANPETYAWAAKALLDGSPACMEEDFPPAAMAVELLDRLEDWQHMATDEDSDSDEREVGKMLLSRMRSALGARHCDAIGRAALGMSREGALRLRQAVSVHGALPDAFKAQADRAMRTSRNDLEEEETGGARDDSVHYCTALAYAQKVAELREISSVKIPQNSKVIEEARMEGDLSENAGYQYAKEEQKMLMQQKVSLAELISSAHIVQADEIQTDRVGFGTRFRAINRTSSQEETYTVMGRWEADAEHHVLSSQAPLALQLTGKSIGDVVTVDLPTGASVDYEILAIENAMASGQWSTPADEQNT